MSASGKKLNIPAQFEGVSIGDDTARVGLKVSRDDIKLSEADHMFCNSRANVVMQIASDQGVLDGMKPEPLDSTADIKGYRVSRKTISLGLTFSLQEIDVESLSHFAKQQGNISCMRVGDAAKKNGKKNRDEEEAANADDPDQLNIADAA